MLLFDSEPQTPKIPKLTPENLLQYLYDICDVQYWDNQFKYPEEWRQEVIAWALRIVTWTIHYCQSLWDSESVERISAIQWKKRWQNKEGDIGADLNYIYHTASWENSSAHTSDSNRLDFLVGMFHRDTTETPLFDFSKDLIPEHTISSESSLAELNRALMDAFIAESKREPYAPKNLQKLREKSQ